MPIAHCLVDSGREPRRVDPVDLWARESGQSAEHMTINIVGRARQFGNRYAVMATLWLPSLWPEADIAALQEGLARAMASYYRAAPREVHVITRVLESGRVVEDGETLQW